MQTDIIIALGIFAVTYAVMLTEKVHKTVAVLAGGCAMVVLHVVSQHDAFAAIDLSVIFLLIGMMVIVHFLAESGFFGYVAIRIAQLARGKPIPLIVLLCIGTAGLSALVDNVTTVLLIAPVTLLVAEQLEVSAIPYLMFEVLASNVGGTATLIGDPPNILIGSAAGLSFMEFIVHLTPITALCVVALTGFALFAIRKKAYVASDIRARVMEMNANRAINDPKMLKQSGLVLALVLGGLLIHNVAHLEPATVALAGAALLLVLTKADPEKVFHAVEWPTLFFFIGLFMVVAGLVATGVLGTVALGIVNLTGDNLLVTSMLVLWLSALASAILGNVPVVTTMIPIIGAIQVSFESTGVHTPDVIEAALWWPLALGACLGGNGTLYGAAANIVVVDIARKNRHIITFREFSVYSLPVTLATLLLASIYVAVRYAP
jgi:Na+/H+ antiporter NhaD/arsenite permease-like protein